MPTIKRQPQPVPMKDNTLDAVVLKYQAACETPKTSCPLVFTPADLALVDAAIAAAKKTPFGGSLALRCQRAGFSIRSARVLKALGFLAMDANGSEAVANALGALRKEVEKLIGDATSGPAQVAPGAPSILQRYEQLCASRDSRGAGAFFAANRAAILKALEQKRLRG